MKSKLLCALVGAVLLAFTVLVFCQQPSPALLTVGRVQVRSGQVQEFLEVSKQVADAIKKAAPTDYFTLTYRTAVGNSNEFWRVTPLNKFADRDGQSPVAKMMTPELAALMTRGSQYVERTVTTIERPIRDLAVTASGAKTPPIFIKVYRTRVKPGMAEQFISLLKTDIMPAIKKMNGSMRIRQVEMGGNTNDFTGSFPFEKWAEQDDSASFTKAMGGEEAVRKFAERMSQIEAGTEVIVIRYVPELSYFPASTAAPGR